MGKKGLLKRVLSLVMVLVLAVTMMSVTDPKKAQAATEDWALVPSDHTPATGMEVPTNVSTLIKTDASALASTERGNATIEDGMLLVGQDVLSHQLVFNLTAGTTYMLSYYVWTTGDDTVYDMHFDEAASPAGTGGNYAYNVFKEWSTTHSAYIASCTIDGVETTDSLTGATGGWKHVEVEWTAKASGAVRVMLGDYGNQSNVTGTIYLDDICMYAKPAEYQIKVSKFWGASSNTLLVSAFTGDTPTDATYTGTVKYNGVDTKVNWVVSGNNFFIKTADTNTQIQVADTSSIEVTVGTKLYASNGNYITITNNCSYVKNSSGNLVASLSTSVSKFVSSSGLVAYTFANKDISSLASTTYTGTLKIDGVETNVYWLASGGNFVIRYIGESANLLDTDITTLQVDAGTQLTNTVGDIVTITNTIKHSKASGSWVETPWDHTPSTGIETPANVTTLIKTDASATATTERGNATIEDGMLVVGTDVVTHHLVFNLTAGTTYVLSYYVWTTGDNVVYDMHFDEAASPAGTGGNYAYNVFKEWSTTHSAYISSCTIDGVETTGSLTGATGGWKHVEVEWTAKANGPVRVMLGDYGNQSNVTGTIYIDDIYMHAQPTEYEINVTKFWGASSNTLLVSAFTGDTPTDATYAGTVKYNGVDTKVNWVVSGSNFFIKTADTNTQIQVADTTSIAVAAGTKMYATTGNCITVLNDCSYVKDSGGNLVIATSTVSTEIALYKISDTLTAYTYTADLLDSFPNGSTFTGNITVNGTTKSVTWTLSDACLIPAGVKDDGSVTSIEVKPGTVLTGTYGTITIENGLKYAKNEDTPVSVTTPIGWYKVSDAGQILFNGIDTTTLAPYVGNTYTGDILLNGTAQTVTWRLDSNLLVVTNNIANYGDVTTIEVTSGTGLTNTDGSGDSVVLSNGLSCVKINGTWYADTNREEVTLSYTYEKVNTTTNQILYKIDVETDLDDNGATNSARGWKTVMVQVGGVNTSVQMFFADSYCTFGNQGASSDVVVTAVKNGTSITIPATFTLVTDTHVITLNFKTQQNIEKLGNGWGMYTEEHKYENNNNTRYYNVDNGTVYTITSSNNAVTVAEDAQLSTGDTISEVGAYNISRIEAKEKWNEKVVLYRHGDVDESNAVTSKDLVALKKEIAQTGDADLAGKQAADMDGNGNIEAIDAKALRYEIAKAETVIDDKTTEKVTHSIEVSKADSVLNGEMLIGGFATPIAEEYANLSSAYELIAGTGINTITYCEDPYYQNGTTDYADQHLELAAKHGLKMYVRDTSAENNTFSADNFATRVGAYSMFESFVGLQIVDEPSYGSTFVHSDGTRNINSYKTTIELCKNAANISGFMNLFPYYQDTWGTGKKTEYQSYIQGTFTDTDAEMLSVDHYAVKLYPSGSTLGALIGWDKDTKATNTYDFYQNLEVMRKNVSDTNKPFWYIAQAGTILPAADAKKTFDSSLYATGEEMQWQINAALAMGARGIQYWQLFQSSYYSGGVDANCSRSGLIGNKGSKNEEYYDAAVAQNAFIKVVDEVLMNAENVGMIAKDSSAAEGLTIETSSYKELASVDGANALVGCFDYYGQTVLYVVNCNTKNSQTITLNFSDEKKTAVTTFGATELNRTYGAVATSIAVNVGAGQAALVIIE